ncbi:MAG: class I SAM-dependent methyltransferase [Deltaproteobacteria bacterium]|nr:MAG: class I SAM-dependent methyltransferase [Deltaproteobacteria bacterium]
MPSSPRTGSSVSGPTRRNGMEKRVDRDWWKSLFDDLYLITDSRSVCDEGLTRKEVDLILELTGASKEWRILDLCGGQGRHALELARRGFCSVTVLDYSESLVSLGKEAARKEGISIHFVRGDARNTGLSDDSFDAVFILGNSFGYFLEEDDDRKVLSEAYRLLIPGGVFLLDVSSGDYVRENFRPLAWHEIGDDIVVCREREMRGDRVVTREVVLSKREGLLRDACYSIRLFGEEELNAIAREAGFRHIQTLSGLAFHEKKGDYGFMNSRIYLLGRK